jgi:flagellar basal-body rod modification protein FlgD
MASGITGTTSSTSTSSTTGAKTIANNFNQFLQLLTAQLKNQSPLDPLDTNQFTQQLVQFSSVEQQLKTNDTLASLLSSTKAATASSVAGFIGLNVAADGATTSLAGGSASWNLTAARAAKSASITVSDKDGNVVATKTGTLAAGANTFTWDGKTSTGTTAPDGDYTVKVTALDTTGQSVSVKTEVSGTVSNVDMSTATPTLLVGSIRVPVTAVKSIGTASGA